MAQQSFREVFVAGTSTLLADGATVEALVDGQIGILDAKTHVSEVTPTYATQKAIKLVWGTPNVKALYSFGLPNENVYTKLIKGRKIKSFKGVAAKPTSTQEAWTIGNAGGASTADLVAAKGEVKHVFLKLTGGQIGKEFSLQGLTKQYSVVDGVLGEAGAASADKLADQLVAAINADKQVNRYVVASKVTNGALRGVKVEGIQVARGVDDATFQYFPAYEQEAVHIQLSDFDPNYNNDVEAVVSSWVATKVASFSPAIGAGAAVRKLEKEALSYHLRERSSDPVVRALEGYKFKADDTKFYDEYILEFDVTYKVPGWAEEKTESHKLHVFFQDGTGAAFETAINGYLSSLGSALDPVAIA